MMPIYLLRFLEYDDSVLVIFNHFNNFSKCKVGYFRQYVSYYILKQPEKSSFPRKNRDNFCLGNKI